MNFLVFLRRHDWVLNGVILLIAAASLVTVASVGRALLPLQLAWFIGGFLIVAALSSVDARPFMSYRWIIFGIYLVSLLLLALTLFVAPEVRGVRAWIPLGPLRFQTSEFAKIVLLMLLAYFFARRHVSIAHPGFILASFVYLLLPAALVFLQPDWGSALVFVGLWVGFLLLSGIRVRHLAVGAAALALLALISWQFLLAPYQRARIVGFLEPSYDPLGVNYSVIQAKIAIGSAGWWGKGFGQGTQAQLGFLTEPATDFALAAFIEEWGIVSGFILLLAFAVLLVRIVRIGWRARDNFGRFVCLGAALVFAIEFFLNAGSNVGLVPVVGVTFPLLSYGGSSLLTKFVLLGIIQGIHARSSF